VNNANGLAGASRNKCFADLIREALGGNTTIHQSTNGAGSVAAAINSGAYTEYGSISSPQVNFDWNLNAKIGQASLYGYTHTRTVSGNLEVYVILGRRAVNAFGPQMTQMALDHEETHAKQAILNFATGGSLNMGANEELEAYIDGFTSHFLSLIRVDNTNCSYSIADDFSPMFPYYKNAGATSQNEAFAEINTFYDVRIHPIAQNLRSFRIWLQGVQNARPANDALVNRINVLPGLGLVKGTNPVDHLACAAPGP
jgi:hypothetical protein